MKSVHQNALSEPTEKYGITRELRDAQPTFPMDDRVGTVTQFSLSASDFFVTRSGDVNVSKVADENKEDLVVEFELHADPMKDEFLLTAVRSETSGIHDKESAVNSSGDHHHAAKMSFLSIQNFSSLVDFIPELTQPFVIECGVPKRMSSSMPAINGSSKIEDNAKPKRKSSWFRLSKRK